MGTLPFGWPAESIANVREFLSSPTATEHAAVAVDYEGAPNPMKRFTALLLNPDQRERRLNSISAGYGMNRKGESLEFTQRSTQHTKGFSTQ